VKPAPAGKRLEIRDTEVAHFALRITERGVKSYIMAKRWPGGKMTIKRTIGDAKIMSLADARKVARSWLELAEKGIDPQVQARKEAEAEARDRGTTFAALAEDFIAEDLAGKRRGARDAQEIRREVLPRWGKLPATSINAGHVIELAKELKDKPATGRLMLSHVKRIFAWALHEHDKVHGNRYGLTSNPAAVISPKRIFGPKQPRQRNLDDDELRALLMACREVPYPIGPCVELLLLTGCRREEIAQAKWAEIKGGVLVVPPERFKSNCEHRVPLSHDAKALIGSLPRHSGPYIFTTTDGEKPVNGWSNAKEEIDCVMARELGREPEHWVLHDLRHVIRTRMAELGVDDKVAEMILGHAKKGMERVYNEHQYQKEMRTAYNQWAELLRGLVAPEPTDKVVRMQKRKRA
jgi:integrase